MQTRQLLRSNSRKKRKTGNASALRPIRLVTGSGRGEEGFIWSQARCLRLPKYFSGNLQFSRIGYKLSGDDLRPLELSFPLFFHRLIYCRCEDRLRRLLKQLATPEWTTRSLCQILPICARAFGNYYLFSVQLSAQMSYSGRYN